MRRINLITRETDGQKNFYNNHGMILFGSWLSFVGNFGSEPWTIIQRSIDGRYNFIDSMGSLISREWFEEAEEFTDELAKVKIPGKGWNYIDKAGRFICRGGYETLHNLRYGNFSAVKKRGKYNFIDNTTGKYIFTNWFLSYEMSNGFVVRVQNVEGFWNVVDKNLNLLLKHSYSFIGPFVNGFATVRRRNPPHEWNYINEEGKLLSRVWFASVDNFSTDSEFARVKRSSDSRYNLLNRNGKFLTRKWFDYISFMIYSGWARIRREDGKYNYINKEGKFLFNEWCFSHATDFNENGFAVVTGENDKKNIINTEGDIILPDWYEYIELSYDASAHVRNSSTSVFKRIKF